MRPGLGVTAAVAAASVVLAPAGVAAASPAQAGNAYATIGQLEGEGYIDVLVVQGGTHMCVGLIVRLLDPLFPRHHASKWPSRLVVSDATLASHKQRYLIKLTPIPLPLWADRCREGVWRSLMSTLTPISAAL